MTEVALLPLLNMSRATPATTFSLTEAYQRAIPAEKLSDKPLPMQTIANPYKKRYQDILGLFAKMPLPISQKEKMAKALYIENKLKAAYFTCIAKDNTVDVEALLGQTETTYQEAKDAIFSKNEEVDMNAWSFNEEMISTLMSVLGKERETFPTEISIHEDIMGKTPLRDSQVEENAENATNKPAILFYSDKMNLEKRKRDKEEQGEKPKRSGYFKRTGNR